MLDLGCGSGVAAIAAAMAGADRVVANDTCEVAAAAVELNAEESGLPWGAVETCTRDRIAEGAALDPGHWVVLCGDVLYDADAAAQLLPWLCQLADGGAEVLVGDPGRFVLTQMPPARRDAMLELVDTIALPPALEREHNGFTTSNVWRVRGGYCGTSVPR